jgi:predicted dehydrogenase
MHLSNEPAPDSNRSAGLLPTAVVGAGRMGQVHARIIAESPRAELVAIIDPNETLGREVAKTWGATWFSNVQNAIEIAEAFVVAVPDRLHVDVTRTLLNAGRHVLVEKPLADTLEGAKQIAAAASASAGHLLVGHVLRHDPRFQLAAQAVQSGSLGEPVHLRSSRIVPRSVGVANAGQSPIYMYQGIHDIDLVQWISGSRILEVCAVTTAKILPALEVAGEDVALILFRLANGAIGTIEISWALPNTVASGLYSEFDLYGTDGAINVSVADQGVQTTTGQGLAFLDTVLAPELGGRLTGAVPLQFDHFVRMIAGEISPTITIGDAVAAVAVLDAIAESLNTGQWAKPSSY